MKKLFYFIFICGISFSTIAQKAHKPSTVEELNKLMSKQIDDKKYTEAIATCNQLLLLTPKDVRTLLFRSAAKARLGNNEEAILDIKKRYEDCKDSAAIIMAILPFFDHFDLEGKSGAYFYKAAIAFAPKVGLPYILYAGELLDTEEFNEALVYANIGFPLLSEFEKKQFIQMYATIKYEANQKTEAYKMLDDEIKNGNTNPKLLLNYLQFLRKDKRYDEAIVMADKLFAKDSLEDYLYARLKIYDQMGNTEMVCRDATLLSVSFSGYENLPLEKKCPELKANLMPTPQKSYVYRISTSQKTYHFTVTNASVDMAKEISFNWEMSEPANKKGKVMIAKEAVNTAHAQMNNFISGVLNIADKTSVWISNEVFHQLKYDGKSLIKTGNEEPKLFLVTKDEAPSEESIIAMNKETNLKMGWINLLHIKSQDGTEELWINDDANNPIIIKMLLGWSIKLIEIKTL